MDGTKGDVEATVESVERALVEIGVAPLRGGDLLGSALSQHELATFIGHFSMRMVCMPYPADEIAALTVRGFSERYVADSYPDPPSEALREADGEPGSSGRPRRASFEPQEIPICFVLGVGRSGTTLFRAMLDVHEFLWAPGELHLAEFDTMADRAGGVQNPFLRHALVAEAAERLRETPQAFSARLAAWESEGLPTTEVYRLFHEAEPEVMVVDKTPSYGGSIEDLDWIVSQFPQATFVHVVRNPHDVIRSMVRIQLYKGAPGTRPGMNPYHVAEILWHRHNANIVELCRRVGAARSLVVRFEDLVARPRAELAAVCDVLGVELDPRMADPYAAATGPVARGAGDPSVNQHTRVEPLAAVAPAHPLGRRCLELATAFGY